MTTMFYLLMAQTTVSGEYPKVVFDLFIPFPLQQEHSNCNTEQVSYETPAILSPVFDLHGRPLSALTEYNSFHDLSFWHRR